MTTSETLGTPRTVRMPDELWLPFGDLVGVVEHTGASAQLRRMIQDYLDEYKVFWAPETKEIDPEEKPIAWYDCDECDMPHRLNGRGVPWGCSVTKAREDRLAKASAR